MNFKLISEVAMIGFVTLFKVAEFAADAKFEKTRALELAVSENSSEELAKYAKAKHDISVRDEVLKREKKALTDAVKEYKKNSQFDVKKNALYSDAKKSLSDFKEQIGYDQKLLDIQKDAEDSIAAFKASVDYDETIESLNKEIADANEKWEARRKLLDNSDESVSEVAMKLKHAEEDAKNEVVKKAKEKKDILEKQLSSEKERFEKKKRDAVRSMEEQISKEKRRLDEKTSRAVNELERDLEEKKTKLLNDIQANRTEQEADCLLMAKDNEEIVNLQDTADHVRSLDISANTPTAEKLAWWLKEHGWTKAPVIFVGFLPLIPGGYLVYRYVKFVLNVANAL